VPVPIGHGAITASRSNPFDNRVTFSMKLAQVIAIDHIDLRTLAGLQKQVSMRSGLIRQECGTARPQVSIGRVELRLIVGLDTPHA
jgi:hypothetical protein